jgi:hypothetical protein
MFGEQFKVAGRGHSQQCCDKTTAFGAIYDRGIRTVSVRDAAALPAHCAAAARKSEMETERSSCSEQAQPFFQPVRMCEKQQEYRVTSSTFQFIRRGAAQCAHTQHRRRIARKCVYVCCSSCVHNSATLATILKSAAEQLRLRSALSAEWVQQTAASDGFVARSRHKTQRHPALAS